MKLTCHLSWPSYNLLICPKGLCWKIPEGVIPPDNILWYPVRPPRTQHLEPRSLLTHQNIRERYGKRGRSTVPSWGLLSLSGCSCFVSTTPPVSRDRTRAAQCAPILSPLPLRWPVAAPVVPFRILTPGLEKMCCCCFYVLFFWK